MADNNATPRTTVGFDDLPYFQDYLREVLKPKIERAIDSVTRSLSETAWRQVVAMVAADQQGAPEIAGALIRPLLEGKLGLKLETKLDAHFGSTPVAKPTSTAPAGVQLDNDNDADGVTRAGGADVMTVRRRPVTNPLANAVMTNVRPPVR